jgi:hypothetical protein
MNPPPPLHQYHSVVPVARLPIVRDIVQEVLGPGGLEGEWKSIFPSQTSEVLGFEGMRANLSEWAETTAKIRLMDLGGEKESKREEHAFPLLSESMLKRLFPEEVVRLLGPEPVPLTGTSTTTQSPKTIHPVIAQILGVMLRGIDAIIQCTLPPYQLHYPVSLLHDPGSYPRLAVEGVIEKANVILALAVATLQHVLFQPMLEECTGPSALVLCSTRQLASDLFSVFSQVNEAFKGPFAIHNLFEAEPKIPLNRRADIVIGTPRQLARLVRLPVSSPADVDADPNSTTPTFYTLRRVSMAVIVDVVSLIGDLDADSLLQAILNPPQDPRHLPESMHPDCQRVFVTSTAASASFSLSGLALKYGGAHEIFDETLGKVVEKRKYCQALRLGAFPETVLSAYTQSVPTSGTLPDGEVNTRDRNSNLLLLKCGIPNLELSIHGGEPAVEEDSKRKRKRSREADDGEFEPPYPTNLNCLEVRGMATPADWIALESGKADSGEEFNILFDVRLQLSQSGLSSTELPSEATNSTGPSERLVPIVRLHLASINGMGTKPELHDFLPSEAPLHSVVSACAVRMRFPTPEAARKAYMVLHSRPFEGRALSCSLISEASFDSCRVLLEAHPLAPMQEVSKLIESATDSKQHMEVRPPTAAILIRNGAPTLSTLLIAPKPTQPRVVLPSLLLQFLSWAGDFGRLVAREQPKKGEVASLCHYWAAPENSQAGPADQVRLLMWFTSALGASEAVLGMNERPFSADGRALYVAMFDLLRLGSGIEPPAPEPALNAKNPVHPLLRWCGIAADLSLLGFNSPLAPAPALERPVLLEIDNIDDLLA